jgi:SAM-dependent methyltransferase
MNQRRVGDPTKRFSGRVREYVRFRPSYPDSLIPLLAFKECLYPSDVVADIGSGTGKLSELLLRNGNRVIGVEPNDEMREAGEKYLEEFEQFRSMDGRAEETGIEDGTVDVIAAGQAFHWFDTERSREEFARILRRGGRMILVWNDRSITATPLMTEYEALLRAHGTDYLEVSHRGRDAGTIEGFFGEAGCRRAHLSHHQDLDLDGLRGRLLSSSYVPGKGTDGYGPMVRDLEGMFHRHQKKGRVKFIYDTHVYYGAFCA